MFALQSDRVEVAALRFTPDGRGLVAPAVRGLRFWPDLSGPAPPVVHADCPFSRDIEFDPRGRLLFVERGGMTRYDLATGTATHVPLWRRASAGFVGLVPGGKRLGVGQSDLFATPAGEMACVSAGRPALDKAVWTVRLTHPVFLGPVFLSGGRRFVVVERQDRPKTSGGRRLAYVTRDTKSGAAVADVDAVPGFLERAAPSPDGRLLAGPDGAFLRVVPADDLSAPVARVRGDSRKQVTGVAFHSSGRHLAATSNDATVNLYDTADWTVARTYAWKIGKLRSVAFSPDGTLAAAGSDAGRIVVWDVDA